ncbi:S-layer homology domain-containing protein [Candidatus Gracilibacteria bacterium]|nr:S-layer homology domain-containing protein [Candidatus Gracilibacteria bacterium]
MIGVFHRFQQYARNISLWKLLPAFLFSFFFVSSAFAADNVITDITLLDTNANGKIDRIQVTIDNDSTNTAALHSLDGITVNDGVGAVTVAATTDFVNASSDPLVLNVDLTEGDTDLTVDTLNADLEFIYVQQGVDAGIEYNDGADTQLVATATGDNDATDTENDGAAPQIKSATYQDGDTDGKIDRFLITFSETLDVASVMAADNLTLSNVGDFTAAAFGGVTTDLITGVASSVTVLLGTESSAFDTSENAGTIEITSVDGNANFSLTDGTNENTTPKAEAQVTFIDGAAPFITGANYYDNDSNGTIDHLVLIFTENVDDSSYLNKSSTISAGGTLTTAAIVAAGTVALDAAVDDRWITLAIAGGTANTTNITGSPTFDAVAADMIDDLAVGNSSLDQSSVAMTDKANPQILTWTLDMAAGTKTATLNFTESVDAATLTVTGITFQDAATATTSYTLTDSTTASANGASIVVTLSATDYLALRNDTSLVMALVNSYIRATTAVIDDLAGNNLVAIADGSAVQASTFGIWGGGGSSNRVVECMPPELLNFTSSEIGKASFEIKPKQNSQVLSNFFTAKNAMTIKLNGTQVPVNDIDIRYGVGTLVVEVPSSVGSVSMFASVPSQGSSDMCYTEETHTVTVGTATTTGSTEGTSAQGSTSSTEQTAPETTQQSVGMGQNARKMAAMEKVRAFTEGTPKNFNDVSSSTWSADYIRRASAANLMTGYADGSGKFGPTDQLTTAQTLAIALRLFGYDTSGTATGDWSTPYFHAAASAGLEVEGAPHSTISRANAISLLARAAEVDLSQYQGMDSGFTDVPVRADYVPAIVWAVENGIVSGYEQTGLNGKRFGPNDPLTREQAAKIGVLAAEAVQ